MPGSPVDAVRSYYAQILPFYDRELAGRGDEGFWTALAGSRPGCRVLEVGAGTGRATAFLARRAREVCAYDVDLDLLARARSRLAGLDNVRLFAADARRLRLDAAFDLVAAVDDPFVHLTRGRDRDRALANVARCLRPGGRFVLDAAWLSPADRRRAATPEGLVKERLAGDLAVRERWRAAPGSRRFRVRFDYRLNGRPAAAASFPARLWSLAELHRRCRDAGLQIVDLWGDYDRRPWHRATSPRLIAEAVRAGRAASRISIASPNSWPR